MDKQELRDNTQYFMILLIDKSNSHTFRVIGKLSKKIYHEGLYFDCIYALKNNYEAWEKEEINLEKEK